MLTDTKR